MVRKQLTFISGGVRSGKSAYAEMLVREAHSERRVYIASGVAHDREMAVRIARHRKDRAQDGWWTIEQPQQLSEALPLIRQNDAVLDSKGKCLGWVLSCAKAGERQVALALVTKDAVCEGAAVGVYYLARSASQVEQGRKEEAKKGQVLAADIKGRLLSRFERF